MTDILTVSLADITPPNLAHDPAIIPIITALDPQLHSLSQDSQSTPLIIPSTDSLSDNALDLLALQYHADFYDLAPGHDEKLSAVKNSLTWHMKKGTASAIIQSLKAIGIEAKFIPWWDYDGQPYTFRIEANITGDFYMTLGKDQITRLIIRAINESKSARSLLDSLDTKLFFSIDAPVTAGTALGLSSNITIGLEPPDKQITPSITAAVISHNLVHSTVDLFRDSEIIIPIYPLTIYTEGIDAVLGVDRDTMQVLLERFVDRIFSRINRTEELFNAKIDTQTRELDAKIDTVIELLRWKGPDEEE